jgi:hypothetical protein
MRSDASTGICSNNAVLQLSAFHNHFIIVLFLSEGRDIAVGFGTGCGLDGTGIESRCGARYSAPVQTGPGAHPAPYTMSIGSFPEVKRPKRGVDYPPSSAEVKERVGLYPFSPSGPSRPVLGWNLPLPLLTPWSRVPLEKLASLRS